LRELLARAATGTPLVALVGGEAGVGKTRLVEQLAATVGQQGVRVLRGGLATDLDPAELEAVAGPPAPSWPGCCPIWPGSARRPRGPAWPPARGSCSSGCWAWPSG
jgi:AAA ATPase domain